MKLWILSDLHLEFAAIEKLDPPIADVCVVAGDVQAKGIVESLEWLEKNIAKHMPVVFVAGNHEFYHAKRSLPDELVRATGYESRRVHFLENTHVEVNGVFFVGGTLWTDFRLFGDEWLKTAVYNAETDMADFRYIKASRNPYVPLLAWHTRQKHEITAGYLNGYFSCNRGRKRIVAVSHHAPSLQSIEPRYTNDLLSAAYASNLEADIARWKPELWIHGHVHHRVDYQLHETRVIANPRGYPGEKSFEDFDFRKVIEI